MNTSDNTTEMNITWTAADGPSVIADTYDDTAAPAAVVNVNPFLATRIKFAKKEEDKEEKEKEQEKDKEVLFLGYSLTLDEEDHDDAVKAEAEEEEEEEVPPIPIPVLVKKTFGILQLDVNTFQQLRSALELIVVQDISGSMSDRCKDGRSKMEHTRFTLERIFDYMVQNNIDVSVGLLAFDNVVEERIPLQVLNSSNIDSLTLELNKLKPRNGTNIGKALDKVTGFKSPFMLDIGTERLVILQTDGQPNEGVTDKVHLKRKVDSILDENTTLVTVGCGVDHDSGLLDFINPGNYYFVDDFEKSGLVCGEFLDKQLNTLLKNVVITVENGEIFSWRENEWVTSLQVSPIVAECNRTYHVRAINPAEFSVRITATSTNYGTRLPFECEVIEKEFDQDLQKYQFRQETLEVLNEVRRFNESKVQEIRSGENGKRIKKSLLELFKRMKDYMDTNNLRDSDCEDAKFMRVLCDDVVVAHRTFGTLSLSTMYINARQTSQGEQRTYNVSSQQDPSAEKRTKVQFQDDDDDLGALPFRLPTMARQYTVAMRQMEEEDKLDEQFPPSPLFLRRNNNYQVNDDDDEEMPGDLQCCSMMMAPPRLKRQAPLVEDELDDIMSQHQMSDCMSTPYANLRQVTMMRGISYQPPPPAEKEDGEI